MKRTLILLLLLGLGPPGVAVSLWDCLVWDQDPWAEDSVAVFTQAQLDQAVAAVVAAKDAIIAERDQIIAGLQAQIDALYTQGELDAAVAEAVAAKNAAIADLDRRLAEREALLAAVRQSLDGYWDLMLWDDGHWFDPSQWLYTQTELDQAVAAAEEAKDQVIAQKDQTIAALEAAVDSRFTQAEVDAAVVAAVRNAEVAKDQTIAAKDRAIAERDAALAVVRQALGGYFASCWDIMVWDQDPWADDSLGVYTQAQRDQAVADAVAPKDATIAQQAGTIEQQTQTINTQTTTIAWQLATIAERDATIADQQVTIAELQVLAADGDGDGFTDEQEAARGTDPRRYVLRLEPGWNLISLARVPTHFSVEAMFRGLPVLPPVWAWDALASRYEPATELDPLRGHWIYIAQEAEIEIVLPDTVTVRVTEP